MLRGVRVRLVARNATTIKTRELMKKSKRREA